MIVYTYGVFDLLHYGHIRSLKQARALGDELVVGVFTDEVAESFKRKPILTLRERMIMLSELGYTVVIQDEFNPIKNATDCNADLIAKGEGASFGKFAEDGCGINCKLLNYTEGISTSEIIKRLC
jgi:glycerol-3-phosphate cytidylyltransferase